MNKIYAILILLVTTSSLSCDMNDDEVNVCAYIMCNPLGLLIEESRSECLEVNARYALYISTLSFFSDPPVCKTRDQNCNIVDTIEQEEQINPQFCYDYLNQQSDIDSCLASIGHATDEYCNQFTGVMYDNCINSRSGD